MIESHVEANPVPTPDRESSAERAGDDRVRALFAIIWAIALFPAFRALTEPGTSPIEAAVTTINPNEAPWWELTALPRIGETLARELASRGRQAEIQDGSRALFTSPRDLMRVRGIGPKTAQRLTPFLHFATSDVEKPARLSRGVGPPED